MPKLSNNSEKTISDTTLESLVDINKYILNSTEERMVSLWRDMQI